MSRPAQTEYRIAMQKDEIAACRELLEEVMGAQERRERLEQPIIYARRDGQVLGFAATRIRKKIISLGRFIVRPGRHAAFTSLRLLQAYENALRFWHVQSYFVGVPDDMPQLGQLLESLGWPVYQRQKNATWYHRVPGSELSAQDPTIEAQAWQRRCERRRLRQAVYRSQVAEALQDVAPMALEADDDDGEPWLKEDLEELIDFDELLNLSQAARRPHE